MLRKKPITPYQRLLDDIRDYVGKIKYRHKRIMFVFKEVKKRQSYTLDDLYERVIAAEQLGYDAIIETRDGDVVVSYVKKLPDARYDWS